MDKSSHCRKTGYPSIDKPWEKYYLESDSTINVPKCTVYQNIFERNNDHLRDVAIKYFGNNISYGTLFLKTDQCAKSLRMVGIKRGDCVTLCTAGVPEAIYLVLACSRIGAIANFINPLFTKDQMIARINETGAKWIFILDEMYSFIEKALPDSCIEKIVIIPVTCSFPSIASKILYFKSKTRAIIVDRDHTSRDYLSWNEFNRIGLKYHGSVDVEYEANTPTVMVYSSGTTGASKGILLTNEGILATNYCRNIPPDPVTRQKTFLQMIPIWFSTGIVISIMIPLLNGSIVIPELQFSKESFCRDLKKYKPNMTLTATSLWMYALSVSDLDSVNLSSLECPITGGEKVSGEDEQAINNFLHAHNCRSVIYKGYGMCELGGTVTSTSGVKGYIPKSCGAGYPLHNVIVAAFNMDTDQELKYGEHGEIRVCTPSRMKEYYKNTEATAGFFKSDSEGRICGCTGDIGYIDKDGEVFILGRATDSFRKDNGEIVYLFDIEEEIFKESTVKQCKVINIKENGETKLVAHLVFKEGVLDTNKCIKRIIIQLSEILPDYMQPNYYKERSSMPVHSNGKRDIESLRSDRDGLKSAMDFQ